MLSAMPAAVRLYNALPPVGDCPLTVREGRRWLEENFNNTVRSPERSGYTHAPACALEISDLWFRYERGTPDVLRGAELKVYEGEIYCLLGGNGSGKSTLLSAAAGLLKPYAGGVKVFGKKLKEYKNQSLYKECLTFLPQDVERWEEAYQRYLRILESEA